MHPNYKPYNAQNGLFSEVLCKGRGNKKKKGDPQAKIYFNVSNDCVAQKVTYRSHGSLALFSREEGTVDVSQ